MNQQYYLCFESFKHGCHVSLCYYNIILLSADQLYSDLHHIFTKHTNVTNNKLTMYQKNVIRFYLKFYKERGVSKNGLLYLIDTIIKCRIRDQHKYNVEIKNNQNRLIKKLSNFHTKIQNSKIRQDENSEQYYTNLYKRTQKEIQNFTQSNKTKKYTRHLHQIVFYKWLWEHVNKVKYNSLL